MKKTFVFAALALCAAALAVSCEKKDFDQPESGINGLRTFTCVIDSDTKLGIDATSGKTTWEVGDEIVIHGKVTEENKTVTLGESDISADGKTATIKVDLTGVTAYDPDGYYAAFPADAVGYAGDRSYYYGEFSNTNRPLMAGYLSGSEFILHNLCGMLSFSATGDYDTYVVSGNNDENVGYEFFQVKANSSEWNYSRTATGAKSSVSGDFVSGETIQVFFPNGVNFSGGFNIKFKKGDEIVKIAKTTTGVNIARNKMLALGSITDKIVDYVAPTTSDHKSAIPTAGAVDLSASGSANSYIISAPGTYKLPAVKGNTSTSAGNVFGVKLMWETYNNAESVTANTVISAVDFEDNWIYFTTPETLKPGNALIAAKDVEDNIIWSWHIWIPETAIATNSYDGFAGVNIMDRNLGALVVTVAGDESPDIRSVGFYYQWGRKDPFMHARTFESYPSKAKVAGEETTKVGNLISIGYSIAHPTHYAYVPEKDDSNWTDDTDGAYWDDNGSKSIYDPCPPGYRVPLRNTDVPMWTQTDEGWTWNKGDAAKFWFRHEASGVVFPLAGYIDCWGGSIAKSNQRCIIWSATNKGTTEARGAFIRWDKDNVYYSQSIAKAKAGSVRCVVE